MKKSLKKVAGVAVVISAASACALSKGESTTTDLEKSGQIYVFESDSNGFNTKTVFYDNGTEVVAFDAQFTPGLAEQAISFLRTKSQNPISYLVVTHPNPDKFNGIGVFKEQGAKIIASKATANAMSGVHAYKKNIFVNIAKMFTEDTYPTLGNIDVNGKPTPTLSSWISDLEELQARFKEQNPVVYGGRGEANALDVAIPQQIRYLKKADAIVTAYVRSLGDRRNELAGADAGTHYPKSEI